jgi:CBS domain-containing protein
MATVRDILTQKGASVATVDRACSVLDAARRMNDHRIGALIVTDDDVVIGIFTERDILTRVVAAGLDPETTAVERVMTSPVCICGPDTLLEDCRDVITVRRIRHLPVVAEGRLVGIVTSGDILAHEAQDRERTVVSLFEYIHGPAVRVAQRFMRNRAVE